MREWLKVVIEAATLLVVLAYTILTYLLLSETAKGNDVARQQLFSAQRAFVLATKVVGEPFGTPTAGFIRLRVQWENSGNTPTKGFHSWVNFSPQRAPLPKGYGFPDLDKDARIVSAPSTIRSLIAPKTHMVSTPFMDIPVTLAREVGTAIHLYAWGWARYRDTLSESTTHITKFCYEVTHLTIQGQNLNLIAAQCDQNNCADEECDIDSRGGGRGAS